MQLTCQNCPGASLPLLKHTTKCYKILAAPKSMLNPRSRQVPQFPLKLIEVQPKKPSFRGRKLLRSGFLWDLLPGVRRKKPSSKSPNRTPFPRPDALWWAHPVPGWSPSWSSIYHYRWTGQMKKRVSMESLCKCTFQSRKALNSTTWLHHCWQWFHHNCNWWADCLWRIAGSDTTFPGQKVWNGLEWCWGEKKTKGKTNPTFDFQISISQETSLLVMNPTLPLHTKTRGANGIRTLFCLQHESLNWMRLSLTHLRLFKMLWIFWLL